MVEGTQVALLFVLLFLMLAAAGFMVGFLFDIPQLETAKQFFIHTVTYAHHASHLSTLKDSLCSA